MRRVPLCYTPVFLREEEAGLLLPVTESQLLGPPDLLALEDAAAPGSFARFLLANDHFMIKKTLYDYHRGGDEGPLQKNSI